MTSPIPQLSEDHVSWRALAHNREYHIDEACEKAILEIIRTPTCAILKRDNAVNIRGIRDWLHETEISYSIRGYYTKRKLLVAVKFTFTSIEDRLLFALRWL